MKKQEIIERIRAAKDYLMQDPSNWFEMNPYSDDVSDFYVLTCGYVGAMLDSLLFDLQKDDK